MEQAGGDSGQLLALGGSHLCLPVGAGPEAQLHARLGQHGHLPGVQQHVRETRPPLRDSHMMPTGQQAASICGKLLRDCSEASHSACRPTWGSMRLRPASTCAPWPSTPRRLPCGGTCATACPARGASTSCPPWRARTWGSCSRLCRSDDGPVGF